MEPKSQVQWLTAVELIHTSFHQHKEKVLISNGNVFCFEKGISAFSEKSLNKIHEGRCGYYIKRINGDAEVMAQELKIFMRDKEEKRHQKELERINNLKIWNP